MTRTTWHGALQQQPEEETTWENQLKYRKMRFLHKFSSHSLLRILKVSLPGSPTNCSPSNSNGRCLSFPKRPSGSRWSQRILSTFPFPSCTLIRLMSWVMEDIWENHLQKSTCHLPQQVATQQLLSLWRLCHGQLQGISSRLDHIDHYVLLSHKYGSLSLTFIHPFITSSYQSELFHSLTSFHVILSSLSRWRTSNVSIPTCFQGMGTHFGSILPTPPESEIKWGCWCWWLDNQLELESGATTMPKSFYSYHAQEFLEPKDTFAGTIPFFQMQLIQILFKKPFITRCGHFANHAATILQSNEVASCYRTASQPDL